MVKVLLVLLMHILFYMALALELVWLLALTLISCVGTCLRQSSPLSRTCALIYPLAKKVGTTKSWAPVERCLNKYVATLKRWLHLSNQDNPNVQLECKWSSNQTTKTNSYLSQHWPLN